MAELHLYPTKARLALLDAARMLNVRIGHPDGRPGVWLLDGPHEPQLVTARIQEQVWAGWVERDGDLYRPTAAGLRVLGVES